MKSDIAYFCLCNILLNRKEVCGMRIDINIGCVAAVGIIAIAATIIHKDAQKYAFGRWSAKEGVIDESLRQSLLPIDSFKVPATNFDESYEFK